LQTIHAYYDYRPNCEIIMHINEGRFGLALAVGYGLLCRVLQPEDNPARHKGADTWKNKRQWKLNVFAYMSVPIYTAW